MDTATLSEQATLDRFNKSQDRVARDMGYGDTRGGLGITQDGLKPLSDYVEGIINNLPNLTEGSEEKKLLRVISHLDPSVIALALLNSALDGVAHGIPWTRLCNNIGLAIRDECFAAGLLDHDATLAGRIESAVRRRHGSLQYRKQAARSLAARAGYKLEGWSAKQIIIAGRVLVDYLLAALPETFVKETEQDDARVKQWLSITPGALERAEQAVETALRGSPFFLPMTEPPAPWTSYYEGGNSHARARFRQPVVRTHYKETAGAVRAAIAAGAMDPHLSALNALQAVAWTVNERVLGVLRWAYTSGLEVSGLPPTTDVPMPPKDNWEDMDEAARRLWKYRASQVKARNRTFVSNRVLMAQDLKTAELMVEAGRFYTPLNCDWRGRIYSIPHFNFARDDRVRALFLFADGEAIGKEGLKWLKVHTANCFGMDKIPIEERVRWTEENLTKIQDMCEIPTKDLWWTSADKPFLFLAACLELASAVVKGTSFVTRLPVSFDGSCSGLQHLSAMTRDEKTAALVNLLPSNTVQDVYQTVATAVRNRVQEDASGASTATPEGTRLAKKCLEHGITRKIVKRNVMTYSYSSKKFGMAQQLMEDTMRPLSFDVLAGKLKEHPFGNDDGRAAAKYLASTTFDAIERLVEKPAAAMRFLQKCARALAHEGKPVAWTTPLGLPWVNRYHAPKVERLNLWLHDARVQMNFADGHEAAIDKDRAANGVAPNFVHALDACHLLMVVNASICENITQVATVHDSYGCLAPRAGRFRQIIREQFAKLYEDNDVLSQVLQQASHDLTVHNWQRLPEPVADGTLDLREVLNAQYAFA